jgi:uncharacterized repeat protein (TIGR02543 family)
LTQVARTQKGFVMHPKGITIGYTVDEDGKVHSDFNLNQNAAGGNLGVTETDNTEARTPMLKYYDFEKEPSNGSEHYTAIRKQSIVTKYIGAEKIAFLFENNLYDLEYLMKYLALSNNTLNEKVSILETEVQRLKETLGTKSLVVYASANPSTAGFVDGSGSYTLEDGSFLVTAYPASGTEYYISSVIITYASDSSSQTFDQATLISRGWLTQSNKRLEMPVDITASRLGDTANVVVNFGLPKKYNLTLNVDPAGSGTVTGSGSYYPDTTARITATPKSDYKFVGWYENGSLKFSADTVTITMSSDRTLTAKFEAEEIEVPKFTISTSVSPTGAGTVTGGGSYESGLSVTLTATPESGYTFKQWTISSSAGTYGDMQNPLPLTANANYTVTAVFEVVSSGDGTLVDGDTITEGVEAYVEIPTKQTKVYLEFTPKYSGSYTFESLDLADLDPDGYIYSNSDRVNALVSSRNTGAFSATYDNFVAGTTYYLAAELYGGTGTLKVKVSYNGSGGSSGGGSNGKVSVYIAENNSTLGSVTFILNGINAPYPSGRYSLSVGDTVTATATPNSGHVFLYWYRNNDNEDIVSRETTYTFTASSDVTHIMAAFM